MLLKIDFIMLVYLAIFVNSLKVKNSEKVRNSKALWEDYTFSYLNLFSGYVCFPSETWKVHSMLLNY